MNGGTIARGAPTPPRWELPAGFPTPAPGVLGLVDGRAVALLREEGELLRMEMALRGGV